MFVLFVSHMGCGNHFLEEVVSHSPASRSRRGNPLSNYTHIRACYW